MKKLSIVAKTFIIASGLTAFGLLLFGVLWVFQVNYSQGMFFGWLLGAAVGMINFGLIVLQAHLTVRSLNKRNVSVYASFLFLARLLLAGGALALSAWLTYKHQTPETTLFNLWTTFAGLVLTQFSVRFSGAKSPWSQDSPLKEGEGDSEGIFTLKDLFSKDSTTNEEEDDIE